MLKVALIVILATFIVIFLGNLKTKKVNTLPNLVLVPTPGIPEEISIPSVKVDAKVESVGLDNKNRMDVPSNVFDTAWYDLGARPGQIGNSVIDGHLDTRTGSPAVFWYLGKVKMGDTINITDSLGKTRKFKVLQVTKFSAYNFPIAKVFGSSSRPMLNLITCGGVWDKLKKNYSERTVVFSQMEN